MNNVRIPLKIEVSFGHIVTPEPNMVTIPALLVGDDDTKILAYTRETIFAEKFQAIVDLAFGNSRIKDFYDIRALKRTQPLDGEVTASALRNTFRKRETDIPTELPVGFSEEFINTTGEKQWRGFISKLGDQDKSKFAEVIAEIAPFCMAFADMANDIRPIEDWNPETGFEARPILTTTI